jgi:hypothetical protein
VVALAEYRAAWAGWSIDDIVAARIAQDQRFHKGRSGTIAEIVAEMGLIAIWKENRKRERERDREMARPTLAEAVARPASAKKVNPATTGVNEREPRSNDNL